MEDQRTLDEETMEDRGGKNLRVIGRMILSMLINRDNLIFNSIATVAPNVNENNPHSHSEHNDVLAIARISSS